MAHLVFIGGKSGTGKSTSGRNLDPDTTLWINADQKALPFKKFKDKYNEEKGNYLKTSNTAEIMTALKKAHKDGKVKTVIIDTWSRMMTDYVMSEEFRKSKGFEKYARFSGSQYDLINTINEKMRDDMVVYFLCHIDSVQDSDGFSTDKVVVQGKQLEKLTPESFSSIVLYADVLTAPGKPNRHVFRTKNGGNDTVKTPIEMFEEDVIDNDLVLVNQAIEDYF
jgi:hypothetical protein